MNELYNKMLAAYPLDTEQQRQNATLEVNQQIILAGLYHGGFFDIAAFYGGTCLRIFHGLQRFSEDMDFSLLIPDPEDNTDVYNVMFQSEKSIKIKIEVDTQPPLKFATEQRILLLPKSFMVRCFTLPSLFAGKMHALVYREWKNRVKGRDWYDFEWYVRHKTPLDFAHFQERALQFNHEEIAKDNFIARLKERLATTDIKMVKADVLPFIQNEKDLDIWTNDYFVRLAEMIRLE